MDFDNVSSGNESLLPASNNNLHLEVHNIPNLYVKAFVLFFPSWLRSVSSLLSNKSGGKRTRKEAETA